VSGHAQHSVLMSTPLFHQWWLIVIGTVWMLTILPGKSPIMN
jgi:hypothetical protein